MSTTRGNLGENLAVIILQTKKFKVLKRNYRCRYGEIDIICSKNKFLYFVEVKSRWNLEKGLPEEAVDVKKLRHIKNCIYCFLSEYKREYDGVKILVIAIIFSKNKHKYKIIEVESI